MSLFNQLRFRMAAAWVCLLAIAVMYAPLAGALVLTYSADCCVGGYCKIPAHHHKKQAPQPEQKAIAEQSGSTDCDHQHGAAAGGASMTQCSMSCCHDSTAPTLMPVAFVLPAASSLAGLVEAIHPMLVGRTQFSSRFVSPLSPPPKFSFSI